MVSDDLLDVWRNDDTTLKVADKVSGRCHVY